MDLPGVPGSSYPILNSTFSTRFVNSKQVFLLQGARFNHVVIIFNVRLFD